jgi:hypothetical protein
MFVKIKVLYYLLIKYFTVSACELFARYYTNPVACLFKIYMYYLKHFSYVEYLTEAEETDFDCTLCSLTEQVIQHLNRIGRCPVRTLARTPTLLTGFVVILIPSRYTQA